MSKYILSIDEGTTSTRALVISEDTKIICSNQQEFTQHYPQNGWVEHDAEEIYQKTIEVCRQAILSFREKGYEPGDISGIAITNQRETTVVWDKKTSQPIHNAIVWQCRRSADYCNELKQNSQFSELVRQKTGLLIDAYFSGTKIKWILENIKSNADLAFGTIDTWLIWKMTGAHLTEASNASRTMLYDIQENKWCDEILEELKIPKNILPELKASDDIFAETDLFKDLCGKSLPIKAVLGDQQAALYAYKASQPAQASKITYGTGTFVLVESETAKLKNGLLTSSFYQLKNGEKAYAIEGSIFMGGALVQWLRDGLKIIESSSEIEALAKKAKQDSVVVLIPALAGLGAPHWQQNRKGSLHGLSRSTSDAEIALATLEAICFSVKDVFNPLELSSLKHINVDGGATKNDLLMQLQADLLAKPIQRYSESEMTALGVAMLTGDVKAQLKTETCFQPEANQLLENKYQSYLSYLGL